MPADVRPYFVPLPGTVVWDDWLYLDGAEWTALPHYIEGWDPGTDVRVQRTVRVDTGGFRRQVLMDCSATILTLSWTSSTTGMTEKARPVRMPATGIGTIEALLEGARLAGVIQMRTTLSLADAPEQAPPGAPWIPGSILAKDERRLALEGTLSMFPVHAIDFTHTRLPINASWHLETSTDLTAPFLGTFRLLINTGDAELDAAVARGAKDKRQQAICDGLEEGVGATMLELAVLLCNELEERESWPPDSVGEVLTRTLRLGRDIRPTAGPEELTEFRTRLASAIRSSGRGRIFK